MAQGLIPTSRHNPGHTSPPTLLSTPSPPAVRSTPSPPNPTFHSLTTPSFETRNIRRLEFKSTSPAPSDYSSSDSEFDSESDDDQYHSSNMIAHDLSILRAHDDLLQSQRQYKPTYISGLSRYPMLPLAKPQKMIPTTIHDIDEIKSHDIKESGHKSCETKEIFSSQPSLHETKSCEQKEVTPVISSAEPLISLHMETHHTSQASQIGYDGTPEHIPRSISRSLDGSPVTTTRNISTPERSVSTRHISTPQTTTRNICTPTRSVSTRTISTPGPTTRGIHASPVTTTRNLSNFGTPGTTTRPLYSSTRTTPTPSPIPTTRTLATQSPMPTTRTLATQPPIPTTQTLPTHSPMPSAQAIPTHSPMPSAHAISPPQPSLPTSTSPDSTGPIPSIVRDSMSSSEFTCHSRILSTESIQPSPTTSPTSNPMSSPETNISNESSRISTSDKPSSRPESVISHRGTSTTHHLSCSSISSTMQIESYHPHQTHSSMTHLLECESIMSLFMQQMKPHKNTPVASHIDYIQNPKHYERYERTRDYMNVHSVRYHEVITFIPTASQYQLHQILKYHIPINEKGQIIPTVEPNWHVIQDHPHRTYGLHSYSNAYLAHTQQPRHMSSLLACKILIADNDDVIQHNSKTLQTQDQHYISCTDMIHDNYIIAYNRYQILPCAIIHYQPPEITEQLNMCSCSIM